MGCFRVSGLLEHPFFYEKNIFHISVCLPFTRFWSSACKHRGKSRTLLPCDNGTQIFKPPFRPIPAGCAVGKQKLVQGNLGRTAVLFLQGKKRRHGDIDSSKMFHKAGYPCDHKFHTGKHSKNRRKDAPAAIRRRPFHSTNT